MHARANTHTYTHTHTAKAFRIQPWPCRVSCIPRTLACASVRALTTGRSWAERVYSPACSPACICWHGQPPLHASLLSLGAPLVCVSLLSLGLATASWRALARPMAGCGGGCWMLGCHMLHPQLLGCVLSTASCMHS